MSVVMLTLYVLFNYLLTNSSIQIEFLYNVHYIKISEIVSLHLQPDTSYVQCTMYIRHMSSNYVPLRTLYAIQ